ncbi:DUF397 domain-containing protein [Streptomyces phaeoluteigriseus]|uniref:DUF397 domain-containing protein n=1 Tax=Streptomyces phaeoluteigriseus TaxID=114686 RepID=UPI0036A62E13
MPQAPTHANRDCVGIAVLPATAAVRDSKMPAGPILRVEPAAFSTFLRWTTAAG